MTAFLMTLTQGGYAALVNVQAGTIGPVEITQIGLSDTPITVASTLDGLPGEIKRLAVAGDTLGDDLIHVSALDDSADAYGYRSFALYTSTGLLFAAYSQDDRIAEKTAASVGFIALDIIMGHDQSGGIVFGDTNFVNPPATTEQQGVVELATLDEARTGLDPLRAITPATAYGALLDWLRGRNISVGLIDAYTPNIGTTGAVRILANGQSGKAILQCLNVDGSRQLGYLLVDDAGAAQWHGGPFNADLLGGHDAGWFADIVSRLGYVPFDSVGFNGPAILTLLKNVDGAGSDLEADLLDGQHGAWYADIAARLGYVPFDSAGFTGAAVKAVLGYTPQDAAASSFGSNASGYWEKRPNGILEQWGHATAGDPWSADYNFPLPFADTASINLQSTCQQSDNVSTDGNKMSAKVTSASTFQLGSDDNPKPVFWRAIGKAPA